MSKAGRGKRIVIVSRRLLVAEGIRSLLEGNVGISQVEIEGSFSDAVRHAHSERPDAMVFDLSGGVDIIIDQPVMIDGYEINTIVLQEKSGKTQMYAHPPGMVANARNLISAILLEEEPQAEPRARDSSGDALEALVELSEGTAGASQPISLMIARASGPSKSRISPSKSVL